MGNRFDLPPEPNRGGALLAKLGQKNQEIANAIGLSRSMISHFRTGRRVPKTLEMRRTFRDLFGIPLEAWDEPVTGKGHTIRGKSKKARVAAGESERGRNAANTTPVLDLEVHERLVPLLELPDLPDGKINREWVRSRARQLARIVDALIAKTESGEHSVAERMQIAQKAAATFSTLGRLSGESHFFDESRLVRMPALRRIFEAQAEILKPWPDALQAAGECLKKLGEDYGSG